jgi:RNA-binding protein NOB1
MMIFRKKNYQHNNRGKIYAIPKPKGGRKNDDLIMREDELMTGNK